MKKKGSLFNSAILLLVALIWGNGFVAQSVGMDHVGPFTFQVARNLLAGVALIPVILVLDRMKKGTSEEEKAKEIKKKDQLLGGICCGAALCVASALQQIGIQYTTVGKAGFITALYIVLVPLCGIFLKRIPGIKVWIGVVLAVIGLYFLCIKGEFVIAKGDILIMGCAAVFTVHILLIDHFTPKVDCVRMASMQFLVAAVLSVVPMLLFEQPHFADIQAAAVPILFAGLVSSGVGYTLQIVGQKNADPTVASILLSMESTFSVLAGWVILHQVLSGREMLGCVFMFAAVILSQLPDKRAQGGAAEAK